MKTNKDKLNQSIVEFNTKMEKKKQSRMKRESMIMKASDLEKLQNEVEQNAPIQITNQVKEVQEPQIFKI